MGDTDKHRHHSIDYVEFAVTDLAAACAFYASAFGWEFNDYGPTYAGVVNPAGREAPEVGGLAVTSSVTTGGGPLVLLYSDDLDATADRVRAAGGQIIQGPYTFPGGRRFHFTDPSGNELGVWATS
ncbi:VOC family protein [Gordonia sp. zg691]|uniref:VOC family protein n=1 Tax=Gordonia jinghuaiqii TaxID=2758710 RepID=A0A7D7RQY0_9ACTN|nr:VOC family protein [Gordonia jinghuaiqii]MBD0863277.1 VOC family protein [Gordonia jinghuaiqii]MCR5980210.1 VOC family protein [Gordonia jinghuaiqii]QMT02033.1 VOC family protein [Gordonia jinghuaiqii]